MLLILVIINYFIENGDMGKWVERWWTGIRKKSSVDDPVPT